MRLHELMNKRIGEYISFRINDKFDKVSMNIVSGSKWASKWIQGENKATDDKQEIRERTHK